MRKGERGRQLSMLGSKILSLHKTDEFAMQHNNQVSFYMAFFWLYDSCLPVCTKILLEKALKYIWGTFPVHGRNKFHSNEK